MKENISSAIIAAAILGSTFLYVQRQPKYEFEIISVDQRAASWNSATVRTNLRTGERCLVSGEGLLSMTEGDWKERMYELPGPSTVCETGKHWDQLPPPK